MKHLTGDGMMSGKFQKHLPAGDVAEGRWPSGTVIVADVRSWPGDDGWMHHEVLGHTVYSPAGEELASVRTPARDR